MNGPISEAPSGSGAEEIVHLRVTGDLDLHRFRPRDLPELLPAWFGECQAAGILTVRVIHGKGSGSLRTGVQALLPRLSGAVASWSYPAPAEAGGWGVTVVQLHPGPGSAAG